MTFGCPIASCPIRTCPAHNKHRAVPAFVLVSDAKVLCPSGKYARMAEETMGRALTESGRAGWKRNGDAGRRKIRQKWII